MSEMYTGVTNLPIPITPEILEQNGLFRHEVDADNPQRVVLSNYLKLNNYGTYDKRRAAI